MQDNNTQNNKCPKHPPPPIPQHRKLLNHPDPYAGLFYVRNGSPQLADLETNWQIIARHYGGLTGLGLVGILLAALLPFIGLLFCCCRCAGNCGSRSEPFDKKHDHCRKVMLSTFLIILSTLILFGVVCAFVTNEYMHDGTRELPQSARTSLKDVKLYLGTTKQEIETLLRVNYDELELALNGILQTSGKIVTEQLAESSHAVSLMNLHDIVAGLDNIKKDLKMMHELTRDLRNSASRLSSCEYFGIGFGAFFGWLISTMGFLGG